MVLTIAILFSYALIEKKISGRSSSEFINFLFSTQEKASSNKSSVTSNKGNSKKGNNSSTQSADTMNYRAVWLSYLEFNSYRKSVKNNNESEGLLICQKRNQNKKNGIYQLLKSYF